MVTIISCEVFRHELIQLTAHLSNIDVVFLEQCLHQQPEDLRQALQKEINKTEEKQGEAVVLLFGYCGGALEGLVAKRARLVVPKAIDCIPIFLGRNVNRASTDNVDTYYLTGGWIDYASNPHKEYAELTQKYDEETARWCTHEMMKAYRKLVFISNRVCPADQYRSAGHEFAKFFDLAYEEVEGNLLWLSRLVAQCKDNDILVFEPGQKVARENFL